MVKTQKRKMETKTMVLGAILTAVVVLVQCLATYTTFFGPFSTAMALVPIVIGAALCGTGVAAWLGFVFGFVVLVTGGGALFWAFNIPGTIITVLLKGTCCGMAAGLVYRCLEKWNGLVAAIASAIICPVVNTGIFLLGSYIFFLPYADAMAELLGMNISGMALFYALATANFLLELLINIILSPTIVRLINIRRKQL